VPAADFLSPIDFFRDLTNPALAFLPRALLIAVVAALVCGSVGVHVVLRGMAFIGDAVAHSVFPGLAIAFVCGGSLVFGGALAGVVTAVLVALLAQNRRLKEDSVIGVLFVGAFALGPDARRGASSRARTRALSSRRCSGRVCARGCVGYSR